MTVTIDEKRLRFTFPENCRSVKPQTRPPSGWWKLRIIDFIAEPM